MRVEINDSGVFIIPEDEDDCFELGKKFAEYTAQCAKNNMHVEKCLYGGDIPAMQIRGKAGSAESPEKERG